MRDGRFVLWGVQLGGESTVDGKKISPETRLHGVLPDPTEPDYTYSFATAPVAVAFTGGILVGKDFVRKHHVHMGFDPAWKFETVLELRLTDGGVDEIRDRSREIGEIRAQIEAGTPGLRSRPGQHQMGRPHLHARLPPHVRLRLTVGDSARTGDGRPSSP